MIRVKAAEALEALKAMHEDANRKGLDKRTLDDIDREIEAYRSKKS